ncbi:hypothetical protein NQ314_019942 [Rhamnusium bicolor]|uniref:Secreted protein n=1 Tax=Rhamnusium bicolor TaxID=1586634 RepID=A0AAV8WMS9_9CUCU|nr:hypothetical protein NQ314_019942 [Rhamnusium bicolor]
MNVCYGILPRAVPAYTILLITLLSLGGAQWANITCIDGNVTPPPIPSPILMAISAPKCNLAITGVKRVQTTLMATEKNITHLALKSSATLPPGSWATMYPQKYALRRVPWIPLVHMKGPSYNKNFNYIKTRIE